MLKSELLELCANGESSGVEFKRDDVRPEQLAKEIVALANFQGGRILLGVEDDGSISGIARSNLEEWVMDTVFGRFVHPQILPFYEEIALDGGARVAVISFTQGTSKPYVVRTKDREEMYVRVGTTSRQATREMQARLFASGGMLHAEALPVSGTGLRDLSLERLEDYLVHFTGDSTAPRTDAAWEQRLTDLGYMVTPDSERCVCSIEGLTLFGRTPRRALRQAGIRWVAFAGTWKEYETLDDAVLDGPLVALMRGDRGQSRELLEAGLIERVVERMTPFISTSARAVNESMRREREWHYPIEALREAVVNALVHRDWTRSLEVEIASYADRLEITSPGALNNSMTVAKMKAGQRSPRNPGIVNTMRLYDYVDALALGVKQKILPLVPNAVFDATDDYVKVTLPRAATPL
jgi:ATP-dependent DNA helicase RecG